MLRNIVQGLNKNIDWKSCTIRLFSASSGLRNKEANLNEEKPPAEKTVLVGKEDGVTLIGINRPLKQNAINTSTAAQLCDAFTNFENDCSSSVAVLYGVGTTFCTGYDIRELATESGNISVDMLMRPEGAVGPTRRRLRKPVVCSINGYCVANGLELALMCDLRVMEESAILGFFNRRFGVPAVDGGTARLPALIGLSRALDLILTGRHVSSDEACVIGLVNRVSKTGCALKDSIQLAVKLSKYPQEALLHDRNSVYTSVFDQVSFEQAIQNEIMYTSKEIITQMEEGIKWFNKTYNASDAETWLKRDRSMADWEDYDVVAGAEKKEAQRKAAELAKIEAETAGHNTAEASKSAGEKPPGVSGKK